MRSSTPITRVETSPNRSKIASDWVAMWPAGAPDVTSGYGGTSPTFAYTADQVTGSETFTVNASTAPGDYEFRYIPQSGTSSIGISAPFTVLEPCATSTYQLTATPIVVTPEGSVTVEWTVTTSNPGGCLSGSDWIAFFEEGAPNNAYGGTSPSFVYTSALATGQHEFTLTGPPLGLYEFRYMRSGSVPAAASELVEVVEPASVPALGPWAFGALGVALATAGWRRQRR